MYRSQATCRHLVKGSFMAMTILVNEHGLFDNASGSFLELLGYSAAVYEFASLQYINDAGELLPVALAFIGRAIEQGGNDPEMAEFTSLSEVFGSDLHKYRSMLEVPFQLNSSPGKRAEFMIDCFRRYTHQIRSSFEGFSGNTRAIMNKAARNATQLLSERLYENDVISDEFFKNNYAFLLEVIEQQSIQERKLSN